jgi:multidrug efflux system membrane fusion protein
MDAPEPQAKTSVHAVEPASQETERSGRGRLLWIAILLLLATIAGVAWFLRSEPSTKSERQSPGGRSTAGPVQVGAATASTADLPHALEALGTVTPLATVTVRTRINGQLVQVGFREGQHVRKGEFLALIDPRPYQAALDQAEGQLARDKALLRNAEVDLVRYRQLVAEDSIARQQLDTQESLVRQYRATIAVDQAQVDSARLNLGYCRIVSPVDGRIGLRQVDEGNYVQTTDANGIVIITQMQPITVVFAIPQDDLPQVLARLREGATLPADAYDRAGTRRFATGVLATVDNQIDTSTGTIKLKAQFDNADEQLFPNQFVNVRLLVNTVQAATVVPSAAVQRGSKGTYVYVVGADGTASAQLVTVGLSEGELTQVTHGIEPGQTVVTDGVDRLRDGIKVSLQAAPASPGRTGSPNPASAQGHAQK